MRYVGYLLFLALLALSVWFVLSSTKTIPSITSPLAKDTVIKTSDKKRAIGFLPFWQLSTVSADKVLLYDEVIYFSLTINPDGTIATRDSDGNAEQGYARFTSDQVKEMQKQLAGKNKRFSVSIVLHDNEHIESFLQTPSSQATFLETMSNLLSDRTITGINFDFEYSGIPGKKTALAYSSFITDFRQKIKQKYPATSVSVDATADSVVKSRLYDIETLAKAADYVILMGYDFYRPTSSIAGPIAPLTGKETYEYDISTATADFLQYMPANQLVLAVAYYGWDFPTVSNEKNSQVEKRPDESVAISTYKRTERLLSDPQTHAYFDEVSHTPWLTYLDPDSGGNRQIWYEDEKSLGEKYDFVRKTGLLGVAIWALGYDGDYTTLDKILKDKITH